MNSVARIERLERQIKLMSIAWVVTIAAGVGLAHLDAQRAVTDDLRVRHITVVDEHGVDRVWIGAPVPDPIVQGQRRKRSGPLYGVVVLDAKGNERGGFATSNAGDAWLGLDSEMGQEARLLVNAGGGGHLTFFDPAGNFARLGIWPGRPTLVLRDHGRLVFEQPDAR